MTTPGTRETKRTETFAGRIDERVKHVGVSKLRRWNADILRDLGDEIYVLQDGDEPIAVLLSYELYMKIQAAALLGD